MIWSIWSSGVDGIVATKAYTIWMDGVWVDRLLKLKCLRHEPSSLCRA